MSAATQSNRPVADRAQQERARGPIGWLLALALGLVFTTLGSWLGATVIEIGGMYTLWPQERAQHARAGLLEDYGYVQTFPRSLMVRDTEAFARDMAGWAAWPFEHLQVGKAVEKMRAAPAAEPVSRGSRSAALRHRITREAADWIEVAYYAAQDTAVRLAIAFYGLPAFAMATCIGLVDGLVRRDLRKWSGGRESSFVYHHAKRFTAWALGFGFAAYLAWPFGGLNPAYLLLLFAALVAASLSTSVSSFKKYL